MFKKNTVISNIKKKYKKSKRQLISFAKLVFLN